jgi:hypothetical protein
MQPNPTTVSPEQPLTVRLARAVAELNGKLGAALGELHEARVEIDRLRRMLATHRFDEETVTAREAIRDELINQLFETAADHARERASRQAWAEEAARLREVLADALDEMRDMVPYVPEYFREKWRHDEAVDRAATALADPLGVAIENDVRVCACVTDEQATTLGPGFSRPVCAVHPGGGGING